MVLVVPFAGIGIDCVELAYAPVDASIDVVSKIVSVAEDTLSARGKEMLTVPFEPVFVIAAVLNAPDEKDGFVVAAGTLVAFTVARAVPDAGKVDVKLTLTVTTSVLRMTTGAPAACESAAAAAAFAASGVKTLVAGSR